VAGAPISTAPAELSAAFAAHALAVQAAMWAMLGAACGWIWTRQESGARAEARTA
jgi:predicted cobalt transporter CbtA